MIFFPSQPWKLQLFSRSPWAAPHHTKLPFLFTCSCKSKGSSPECWNESSREGLQLWPERPVPGHALNPENCRAQPYLPQLLLCPQKLKGFQQEEWVLAWRRGKRERKRGRKNKTKQIYWLCRGSPDTLGHCFTPEKSATPCWKPPSSNCQSGLVCKTPHSEILTKPQPAARHSFNSAPRGLLPCRAELWQWQWQPSPAAAPHPAHRKAKAPEEPAPGTGQEEWSAQQFLVPGSAVEALGRLGMEEELGDFGPAQGPGCGGGCPALGLRHEEDERLLWWVARLNKEESNISKEGCLEFPSHFLPGYCRTCIQLFFCVLSFII